MSNANKMLIDATHPEETRVVVLRNGRVEEFDYESAARKLLRGNIYLAKVTRVEPALQAAFVDYGGNRHGFLAFSEIHPDYYQIPIADRIALLEEEAAIEAEEEAEADARAERMANRRGGGGRSRRSGRGRGDGTKSTQRSDSNTDDDDHVVDAGGDGDQPNVDTQEDDALENGISAAAATVATIAAVEEPSDDTADQDDTTDTTDVVTADAAPAEPSGDTEQDEAASNDDPAVMDDDSDDGDIGDHDDDDSDEGGSPPRTIAQSVGKDPTLSAAPETPDDVTEHNTSDRSVIDEDVSEATPDDTDPVEVIDSAETSDEDTGPLDGGVETAATEPEQSDGADEVDTAPSDSDDDALDVEARKPHDDDNEDEDDDDSEESDSDQPEDVDTEEDALEEVAVRPRRTRRSYKIQEVIKRRQVILIQVVKEERGNKGAALTTYLSLAGRYTVLMPNTARGGGISR
ncbi:MAG: ribonuclease E/G, partial [Planctomycetota bacterium]